MIPYLKEDSVSIPEIAYLAKLISDIFRSVNRKQPQKLDLEWTSMPSHIVSIYQYLLKGWRLWNQKQKVHWHWIWMRENDVSLDLNFISVLRPTVDEKRDLPTSAAVYFQKMMPRTIETFCKLQIHWMFPLFLLLLLPWLDFLLTTLAPDCPSLPALLP